MLFGVLFVFFYCLFCFLGTGSVVLHTMNTTNDIEKDTVNSIHAPLLRLTLEETNEYQQIQRAAKNEFDNGNVTLKLLLPFMTLFNAFFVCVC
jgi:ABC-type transport system involved in multi-copper enzyme maturation permease subunit